MLYAILAYHVESEVMSWTAQEDAAVMSDLNEVHDRLTQNFHLGPAARLGPTQTASHPAWPGGGSGRRRAFCRDQGATARLLCHGICQRG